MTEAEKRAELSRVTGEKDPAELSACLARAEAAIRNRMYPFGDGTETIPPVYDYTQLDIAEFIYNKRGAIGEKSHSENGVSRTYEDGDIPPSLMRRVTPFVKVV